ncbi:MAG: amidase family protein [Candidatus Hodgkinia cicadicola]
MCYYGTRSRYWRLSATTGILNGVISLKPTYGRCSRWGVISYCSSLDQIGVLAKTANDCAKLSTVVFGKDAKDWNSVWLPVPEYKLYTSNISKLNAITLRRHSPCSNENWSYSLAAFRKAKLALSEAELRFANMIIVCCQQLNVIRILLGMTV